MLAMNVLLNGAVAFSVRIEKVSCFYFCPHFYQLFKEKHAVKELSTLRSVPENEIIVFCQPSEEKIRSFYVHIDYFYSNYFQEAKKL